MDRHYRGVYRTNAAAPDATAAATVRQQQQQQADTATADATAAGGQAGNSRLRGKPSFICIFS